MGLNYVIFLHFTLVYETKEEFLVARFYLVLEFLSANMLEMK
jgi:hypothetical protein